MRPTQQRTYAWSGLVEHGIAHDVDKHAYKVRCATRGVKQVEYTIAEHPRESIDWRRHRYGCPYYRERWFPDSVPELGEPMYQVYCMKDTPPESWDEQERCLASRARCWRSTAAKRLDGATIDIPLTTIKRRTPANESHAK